MSTDRKILREFFDLVVERILLVESNQLVTLLSYPPIIASLFIEIFGKNAFTIAKWYKEYTNLSGENNKNWWRIAKKSWDIKNSLSLPDMVDIFEAASSSEEEYDKVLNKKGLTRSKFSSFNQSEILSLWKEEIREKFLEDIFFNLNLIKDIMSGKIKDLKPFKNLSFSEAIIAYDEKNIFKNRKPIKIYSNGWKWIDVGYKCDLVGKLMKNCGSAGIMSSDKDRTIIALFDENNKPHVIVTYSPNEKRISGDEGTASTPVKDIYHDYVLDLAKTLNVRFDFEHSKSKVLRIKVAFGPENIKNIENIFKGIHFEFYFVEIVDGQKYYTDSYYVVPQKDVIKLLPEYEGNIKETLIGVFGLDKRFLDNSGIVKYIPINKFLKLNH